MGTKLTHRFWSEDGEPLIALSSNSCKADAKAIANEIIVQHEGQVSKIVSELLCKTEYNGEACRLFWVVPFFECLFDGSEQIIEVFRPTEPKDRTMSVLSPADYAQSLLHLSNDLAIKENMAKLLCLVADSDNTMVRSLLYPLKELDDYLCIDVDERNDRRYYSLIMKKNSVPARFVFSDNDGELEYLPCYSKNAHSRHVLFGNSVTKDELSELLLAIASVGDDVFGFTKHISSIRNSDDSIVYCD